MNPALLTLQEYLAAVDPKEKSHPDSAYDVDINALNQYGADKTKYDKFIKRVKIKGLTFDFYLKDDKPHGITISVFNDEDERVAASQDEWGAMLIRVAREYRGFGLGPILGKLARAIEPMKPSGGFTYSGKKNFIKVYREFVRDALKNGTYAELVRANKMTIARVKEIIASASLDIRPQAPQENLNNTSARDWVLYVGEYGDYILYDKKLAKMIEDRGYHDYWTEKMMKGLVLVREPRKGMAILVQFGGDNAKIKTFMMTCALSHCKNENLRFFVDPEDRIFVDPKCGKVAEQPDWTIGHERYEVELLDVPNMDAFAPVERQFRKSFDQYDEFKNHMMEMAYTKFRQSQS